MADTTTSHYSLIKPEPGAAGSTWGISQNAAFDIIDATMFATANNYYGSPPTMNGVAAAGVATAFSRGDHVHPIDTSRAPLASPTFSGTPAAPTPSPGDSTTKLATTAFVAAALTSGTPGSSSATPLMDGVAAAGGSGLWSRGDHVHPSDTSRYAATNPSGYQTAAQVTAALPTAYGIAPAMNGAASSGASGSWSRGDHVHPVDTSRYAATNPSGYQTASQVSSAVSAGTSGFASTGYVDASVNNAVSNAGATYLPFTGGTLTGSLTCSTANPLTITANSASNIVFNPSTSGVTRRILGRTGGNDRWIIEVGNATAEGGGSSGSDFSIARVTDAGGSNVVMSSVRATGVCTFTQTIVNSDRRVKTNVSPLTNALSRINQITGVSYKHRDINKQQVGLVAQDLLPVLPEAVFESAPQPDDPPGGPLLGVAYGNVVALLINAINELTARVAVLEAHKP